MDESGNNLAALVGPVQQIAAALARMAESAETLVAWITSPATLDEASFALERAIHPAPARG